ncbi:MAG: hypothetical protein ACERKZ_19470 [Lachnotalea sp.]
MKKAKIGLIILVLGLFIIIIGYYKSQNITNKDEKILQVYNLLDDTLKQKITDMGIGAKIKKFRIRASNRRFTSINKDYYGKVVYAVTFPINDGRPEKEFIVLCDLGLTKIVGYGVLE